MRSFSSYKILGSWVPAFYNLPRWFEINANSSITSFVALPETQGSVSSSRVYSCPVSSLIPVSWLHTNPSIAVSGFLAGFFSSVSYELETLRLFGLQTSINSSNNGDIGELDFAWIASSDKDVIERVEVGLDDGTYTAVNPAKNDLDLFYSGSWAWKKDEGTVLLSGIDLQQHLAVNAAGASGWLFLDSSTLWNKSLNAFLLHPYTGHPLPIHNSELRSDGLTGFYENSSVTVRTRNVSATIDLDVIGIKINGRPTSATRIPLWTGLDELGLYLGIRRRTDETLPAYKNVLYNSWAFLTNQNLQSVCNYISGALRLSSSFVYSTGLASSIVVDRCTGATFLTVDKYSLIKEILSPVVASGTTFLSTVPDYEAACMFLNGDKYSYTVTSRTPDDGYKEFSVGSGVRPQRDLLIANWMVQNFSFSPSALTLTDSMPKYTDSEYLISRGVTLVDPDTSAQDKAIAASYLFRWPTGPQQENYVALGASTFV